MTDEKEASALNPDVVRKKTWDAARDMDFADLCALEEKLSEAIEAHDQVTNREEMHPREKTRIRLVMQRLTIGQLITHRLHTFEFAGAAKPYDKIVSGERINPDVLRACQVAERHIAVLEERNQHSVTTLYDEVGNELKESDHAGSRGHVQRLLTQKHYGWSAPDTRKEKWLEVKRYVRTVIELHERS